MQSSFHTTTVNCYPFRGEGFEAEFLLLKKPPSPKSGLDGLWQVVSRKQDDGEPLWAAALRELHEETGCRPLRFFEIGVESYYSHQRECICLHPSFAAEIELEAEVRISDEHEQFEWLPFDEALLRLPFPNQREMITRVRFNVIDAGGRLPFEIPEEVWRRLR